MRALILIWAVLTGTGAVLIALPDTGPRLVEFSGEHGPGLVDGFGIVALLAGFLVLLAAIVRRRKAVGRRLAAQPWRLAVLAFMAGTGTGMLLAGVFTDFWWWWLVGMTLTQVFWVALFMLAVDDRGSAGMRLS